VHRKATVYVLSSTNYEENLKLYKRLAPMHYRGIEYADPAVAVASIRALNLFGTIATRAHANVEERRGLAPVSGPLKVDQVHFLAEVTASRDE